MGWDQMSSSDEITPKQREMLKRLKIDASTLNNKREAIVAIQTKTRKNRLPEINKEHLQLQRQQNEQAIRELWNCCEGEINTGENK